jgi:transcription-repair coupling factor (superfamily II helicase)
MNLEVLQHDYLHDPRCLQLADRLASANAQSIHLKGLQGSSPPFIITAIFEHPATSHLNHLIILRDAEEAAYFHNTLENLTGALDLFYFPSSFKNKKNYRLLNSSHVMLRTEALTRIAGGGNKKLMVTYPEALFEKVIQSQTLSENIVSIKQNDSIDPNGIIEKLVGYGFTRTDFVYEPGQFAIRGGIFDIYSYGNEKPYRIELFGNEVDSIRIFDPESQLSERKILQVKIIPNVEALPTEDGEKISLIEYLPENTVVWMQDWNYIKEKIEQQEEDLEIALGQVQLITNENNINEQEEAENNSKKNIDTDDFIKASALLPELQKHNIIEFGVKPFFRINPFHLLLLNNPLLTDNSIISLKT